MIALRRILVPHDFSDTSEAAVRYAIALAHNFGAQLHLLHVSDKAKFEMATEFNELVIEWMKRKKAA